MTGSTLSTLATSKPKHFFQLWIVKRDRLYLAKFRSGMIRFRVHLFVRNKLVDKCKVLVSVINVFGRSQPVLQTALKIVKRFRFPTLCRKFVYQPLITINTNYALKFFHEYHFDL